MSKAKRVMYQGVAMDRMGSLPDKKTKWHTTYLAAHTAAEKLCKKYFSGSRGKIDVIAKSR